jgi:hypothetical protein
MGPQQLVLGLYLEVEAALVLRTTDKEVSKIGRKRIHIYQIPAAMATS